MVKPAAYRQAVGFLRGEFETSERRACSVLGFRRSSCRYVARRVMVPALLDEIRAQRRRGRGSAIDVSTSCSDGAAGA